MGANFDEIMGMTIGLVSVIMALSIPIAYLVLRYRRARRAMELLHAERMAAIERGMELPPVQFEIETGPADGRRPRTALLPGLMWLFVGLAIVIHGLATDFDGPPLFVGLIPVGIGLAYLIYYYVEERRFADPSVHDSVPLT